MFSLPGHLRQVGKMCNLMGSLVIIIFLKCKGDRTSQVLLYVINLVICHLSHISLVLNPGHLVVR